MALLPFTIEFKWRNGGTNNKYVCKDSCHIAMNAINAKIDDFKTDIKAEIGLIKESINQRITDLINVYTNKQ
jgi:hypothetical protein